VDHGDSKIFLVVIWVGADGGRTCPALAQRAGFGRGWVVWMDASVDAWMHGVELID
jgi:hypothetical protein